VTDYYSVLLTNSEENIKLEEDFELEENEHNEMIFRFL